MFNETTVDAEDRVPVITKCQVNVHDALSECACAQHLDALDAEEMPFVERNMGVEALIAHGASPGQELCNVESLDGKAVVKEVEGVSFLWMYLLNEHVKFTLHQRETEKRADGGELPLYEKTRKLRERAIVAYAFVFRDDADAFPLVFQMQGEEEGDVRRAVNVMCLDCFLVCFSTLSVLHGHQILFPLKIMPCETGRIYKC